MKVHQGFFNMQVNRWLQSCAWVLMGKKSPEPELQVLHMPGERQAKLGGVFLL